MNPKPNNQTFFPFSRTMAANLESDLKNLLLEFSAKTDRINDLAVSLIVKYSEEHRFYHNLSHINALLWEVENLQKNINDLSTVKLAVWFHDAVYEPKSSQNERRSAALAVEKLNELGFLPEKIKKVEQIILATRKHSANGLDADGRLFLDLDLSILGTSPEIYQKYALAIRTEYAHVPQALYTYTRSKILKKFLGRPFIYLTDFGRANFEKPARLNITKEIDSLSKVFDP